LIVKSWYTLLIKLVWGVLIQLAVPPPHLNWNNKMSIIKNHIKDNFTQIPNSIILDTKISDKSFRVLAYLLSKDTGWNVYNKDIQSKLNIKQSSTISKCWKELESAGYITRERVKSKDGLFLGGYIYHISNQPILCENHIMEKPTYGKTHTLNKTRTNNNTKNNNTNYKTFIEYLKQNAITPSKVTSTKSGIDLFNKIENKKQLAIDYIEHQKEKGEYAKRITAFMEDYKSSVTVLSNSTDISKMKFSSIEAFTRWNANHDDKYSYNISTGSIY